MKKYILLKDFYSLKESLGEIPENTCPNIDKIKKDILDVEKLSNVRKRSYRVEDIDEANDQISELESILSDINSLVWNMDSALEDLRSDNSKLRDLGREWYTFSKEICVPVQQSV